MDFRSFLPLVPAMLRAPMLALADRLDREAAENAATRGRVAELERRLAAIEARAIPGANHPPL